MNLPSTLRLALPALLAGVLLLGHATASLAAISGSKHDFSASGFGSDEICIFCHTPHNASTAVAKSPLWNHELSTATYMLYSSPSLQQAPQAPRGPSKLCLSCHDGTVAINSFGGQTGTKLMTGLANLGTDLSNDHPISIYWNHQDRVASPNNCGNCHAAHGSVPGRLPFYDRYVECPTCHEPHNNGPEQKMLRKSMNQSQLCMQCH